MKRAVVHVGILASLAPATGNYALALRLQCTFEQLGYKCSLFDVHDTPAEFTRRAAAIRVDVFLGIHLLRAGGFLVQQQRPYALVIGGTDVNEHAQRVELRDRMNSAITTSHAVVGMHPDLRTRFISLWPQHASKVVVIPAAVYVCVPREPSSAPSFRLHAALGLPLDARIFLLPTNLRSVKDPLYLVPAFEAWHRSEPSVHLVLVGPVLDAAFGARVKAEISPLSGVHYHDAISPQGMQEAMQQAFAVLNSSRSEGLSTAIMEAMALERPVLARRNAGNASLIKSGDTGILFDAPDELVLHAKRLLDNPSEVKYLTQRAREWVMEHFSPAKERRAYATVLLELTQKAKL